MYLSVRPEILQSNFSFSLLNHQVPFSTRSFRAARKYLSNPSEAPLCPSASPSLCLVPIAPPKLLLRKSPVTHVSPSRDTDAVDHAWFLSLQQEGSCRSFPGSFATSLSFPHFSALKRPNPQCLDLFSSLFILTPLMITLIPEVFNRTSRLAAVKSLFLAQTSYLNSKLLHPAASSPHPRPRCHEHSEPSPSCPPGPSTPPLFLFPICISSASFRLLIRSAYSKHN